MSEFETKSEEIKQLMADYHSNLKLGKMISDKEIVVLSKAFYERDKKGGDIDIELLDIMRGFVWGMSAMRQIVEGNNL